MLAERVTLGELKAGGLLKGEVDDMMKVRLGAIFQPHGLGHLMGLDVHDVGGFPQVRQLHCFTFRFMCISLKHGGAGE